MLKHSCLERNGSARWPQGKVGHSAGSLEYISAGQGRHESTDVETFALERTACGRAEGCAATYASNDTGTCNLAQAHPHHLDALASPHTATHRLELAGRMFVPGAASA